MLRESEKLRFAEGRGPRRGGERGRVRAWGDVSVSGPRLKAVALLRTLGFFSRTCYEEGPSLGGPLQVRCGYSADLSQAGRCSSSAWAGGHSLQCPFPFLGEKLMVGVEG